ncbi:MAG: lysylphosphatidylglycerol synthase transmembrane domain-containing protein [Cytophagaceae bacterium]
MKLFLTKRYLYLTIKWVGFFLAILFLWYKLQQQEAWWLIAKNGLYTHGFLYLLLVLFLGMFVQYSMEAYKWKLMVNVKYPITLLDAIKATFQGSAFAFVTPHGIGDYYGRLMILPDEVQSQAIASTAVSRWMQLIVTALFGLLVIPFTWWSDTDIDIVAKVMYWVFSIGIIGVLYFCWIKIGSLKQWLDTTFLKPYTSPVLQDLQSFSKPLLIHILGWSGLRYIVFSLQFALSLYFFGIKAPWYILAEGIILVYMAKSVFPTFLDLGVRELTAVFFFSSYGYDSTLIMLAGLTIWLVNMVSPAVIGWLWILVRPKEVV